MTALLLHCALRHLGSVSAQERKFSSILLGQGVGRVQLFRTDDALLIPATLTAVELDIFQPLFTS